MAERRERAEAPAGPPSPEYPRGTRGGAARGSRNTHVAPAAAPQEVHGIPTWRPRQRRETSAEYPRPGRPRARLLRAVSAKPVESHPSKVPSPAPRRCPPISSATHWLDETCVAERSAASSGTGMVVGKDVERLVQRRHLDGGLASVGRSRARAPFSGRRVARRGREVAGSKCGVTAAARRRLGSVSLGPGGPTPALSHAEFGPARRSGAQQRRRMHSTPAVSRRRLGASDGRLDVS